MLPAEADLLLPQLVRGLPKPLQLKLRGLSLQDLVAPLSKDAQGKPQPGKSDPEVDTKLPKVRVRVRVRVLGLGLGLP